MGLHPGIPDLLLVLPHGASAWLEFKAPKGIVSPAQRDTHARLEAMGHRVAVVRSIDQLRAVLAEWGIRGREAA